MLIASTGSCVSTRRLARNSVRTHHTTLTHITRAGSDRTAQVQPANILYASMLVTAATVTAVAVLLTQPVPAEAISGGKESVGIFRPLDDEDFSGKMQPDIMVNDWSLFVALVQQKTPVHDHCCLHTLPRVAAARSDSTCKPLRKQSPPSPRTFSIMWHIHVCIGAA